MLRNHRIVPLPTRLLTTLLTLICACAAQQDARHDDQQRPRPNILFAMADDWGWPHAGAYGDEVVQTPTFDRLAREGVRFEHAYVSSPSCTPSRNAILTGQAFYRLGEGANLHSTLDVAHPTFVRLLRDAGYRVAHWRKAWGPGNAKAGGYDGNPCGPNVAFADFLAQQDDARPFCFWLGTSDPHRGYQRHSGRDHGIDPAKVRVPAFLPDHDDVRGDLADYYFEVQRWDRDVGAALQLLERRGLLANTIVVMTGDHGMPFPRCKGNLYDHGARVPLAIRWGRVASPGRTVRSFASLTDLAPTFLEAAGVAVPDVMTGDSLLAVLTDPDAAGAEHVVFGRERHTPAQQMPSLDGYPARAIRTHDWLLIHNVAPERWPAGVPEGASHPMGTFADCDNGPSKTLVAGGADDPALRGFYQLCFGKRPAFELYDCRNDPDQIRDLAGDVKYRKLVVKLRYQLIAELRAHGDPRFTDGVEPRFDEYPYRAGYLKKHLEKHGHR
ncbi:MAG: sulfatase [Planctomycetes bacterium]|nr:sulfatase [Planctomycetota bacterium]